MNKLFSQAPSPSRRGFLAGVAAVAGGASFGFHIPFADAAEPAFPDEVNAWVVVKPDDTVVIRIARSEMGQGTLTGLAQMVAEELECDWSKVTTEYPTPGENLKRKRVWGAMATGGSRGIRESHQYVREGGAAAREMLIAAAAKGWGVKPSECKAENSVITHAASGRSTTYGKVAAEAAKMEPPKEIRLKDPKDWGVIGKSLLRLDTKPKTDGSQVYGMDLSFPNMLNAAIKDCPVHGGTLKSVNSADAEKEPGVRGVVRVGDSGVAVVADTFWQAKLAADLLEIEWDPGKNGEVSSASLAEWLKEGLDAKEAFVGNKNGDAAKALGSAARVVEATYSYPLQNHACMEPMNATAIWTEDRCEVWTPTQNGEGALAATIAASGHDASKCDVHKVHLGGGFGRRGATHDWVTQVVEIAKKFPGRHVKLIWTREEDMIHGRFHPITQCRMRAALNDKGELTGMHMRISGQSIVAAIVPGRLAEDGKDPFVFQGLMASGKEFEIGYTIPNLLIDHAMRNPHLTPGFWRGVNTNPNAIYLECFMDELAHATGQDPLAFRLKLMENHPKHRAVLQAVADKIGWDKPAPKGIYRGLAQVMGFGAYVAGAAEVSVTDGELKVHRIVAATDPGYAVNPQQIEAQVEGSFVYGLSAALYGEMTVEKGRVVEENFNTYRVMKLAEMPKVESILMPSGGFWGGVGEPTIAVAAPAVLNAVFAATGKRVRNIPLKNTDLKQA
ncbi:xanthine dehydrogenase family protein molybdopterin-binding subunit [Chenggangzhangella methanolivorans]|uniref:Molybdopterin-dependent oxidoreductase n=1 Tax=Chenggangzhangella methanolivorans TaxID=1437009 RepID=A0A9E6UI11_9HYPH|nr:molybdopterin cofactor-binding domain-containing protein [Chenggangzhangella methanolivorans]QZO00318.1 molybdopterin-dependent oxidoreductase [Chenggangzhangella methanolivorans]